MRTTLLLVLLAPYTAAAVGTARAQAAHPGSLDSRLQAAERHHYAGRLSAARDALLDAEAEASRIEPVAARLARVWIARGNVWLSQTTASNSGYPQADSAAARAMELAQAAGDSVLVADAADLAGRVLYSRRINLGEGDYDAPLRQFKRALTLRHAAGDTRGIVESMFRIGLIHERNDEGDRAVEIYDEARRLAGSRYPLERSNLARHLAYQFQGRGELDRALALFQESLTLREQAGFILTRPSALLSIADLYRRKQDYPKARDYARRGLAAAERLEATRFVVGALISLGEIHAATSDADAAREQWTRAEALAEQIGYVSGVRQARERLDELADPGPSP